MVKASIIVRNKSGIHARPAAELSKLAAKCKSDISLNFNGKRVNPKSILNLLSASINCGCEVELECKGDTEEQDLKMLAAAIEAGLGE
ncbi:HPr family phosphocarrier protein [Luxibacter massiliensis]|uniref:HPr family phosphocarrier protein n=1 Tax=Luxibacter massiliensis TaxID=2219695 RepID=UPI000F060B9E|nr:HPr family phosphocarrier protein [Luxibacter massiliensis]